MTVTRDARWVGPFLLICVSVASVSAFCLTAMGGAAVSAERSVIRGTPGPDLLEGTRQADTIRGLGGIDIIVAGDRDDFVTGDQADDHLELGRGDDTGSGHGGTDVIYGGSGKDRIFGGPGTNILRGGQAADYFSTTIGAHDIIDGGLGSDLMILNAGEQAIWAKGGKDIVRIYPEHVTGTEIPEVIRCGAGEDRVVYMLSEPDPNFAPLDTLIGCEHVLR